MKKSKRILAALICAVMVTAFVPAVSVSAATYSGTCGDNLKWTLKTSTGVLTISGTGEMTDYFRITYSTASYSYTPAPWSDYKTSITSVVIKNGVTSIGNYAFYECSNLASITIPNGVTSIGGSAFSYCYSLTSITIPTSVTSIGGAFYDSGITTVYYDGSDADWNAIDSSDIFLAAAYGVSGTSSGGLVWIIKERVLTVSGGDMQDYSEYSPQPWYKYQNTIKSMVIGDGVTYIGTYAGPSTLTSVTIGNSVTSIGNDAFAGCSSLTNVTIPDSVTSIGYRVFRGCTSLANITIPDSVTSIGSFAFYNTAYYNDESNWDDNVLYIGNHLIEAKTTIEGNYDIKNGTVTIAASAFSACSGLTDVIIPNSVSSINTYAFHACSGLMSMTIPDSVTSIGSFAFNACSNLTKITISDNVTSISGGMFYDCTGLTDVTIPNSVTSIGSSAFYGCSALTGITIPNSVTSIGYYAFTHCTGLTDVIIGNGVTSIGYDAFYNTAYYNDESNWEDNVLYIGKYLIEAKATIEGNYNIKKGTLAIAQDAFNSCQSLTSVTIPDSVAIIDREVFNNCSNLTSVTIPNSVKSIEYRAFAFCSSLTNIKIPNSVLNIGERAFYYSGLTSIVIPDSVTNIDGYAFYRCTDLTKVVIGNGVTEIGEEAFESCSSMTSVMIGSGVTAIGKYAFYCQSLTDVYYPGSEEEWNIISIGSGNTYLTDATIHYNCVTMPTEVSLPAVGAYENAVEAAVSVAETGSVTVNLTITDESALSALNATAYAVSYSGGAVENVDKLEKTVTDDGAAFSGSVSGSYKIFIWDENMQPITEAAE